MNLLYDAIRYAESGQPVFPCYPLDLQNGLNRVHKAKTPMTPNGHLDATTDLDQITDWWTRWSHPAIGLPTGMIYDVLDVDKKPGGVNGYVALNFLGSLGLIYESAVKIVSTPSGGRHYYFPASGSMTNATFARHGIDLRGIGGYVIAPPSVIFRRDGNRGVPVGAYTLKGEREAAEGAPLDHERVRHLLRSPEDAKRVKPGGQPADSGSLVYWLSKRGEGERNASLYWAACRMVEAGDDPLELLDTAREIGLSDDEALRTIESAQRAGGAA